MKTIHVLAVAFLITGFASAQTKRADRLFDEWKYYKAAELYRKAVEKHPTQDAYYKLGECYQKMHRNSEAAWAYDKVDSMGHYDDASFYLNYGLVLKNNERYDDAKKAFIMYAQMVPNDQRGSFYFASCDTVIKDILYNLPVTITGVSSLNSSASDLCPVLYKNGVVFISSRQAQGHGMRKYDWDNEYYLDVFTAKKGKSDVAFEGVAPISSDLINGKYHNGPVTFSKNYDTVYFNRVSRELKGKEKRTLKIERNKIYYAVRKDSTWSDLQPFPYNNDTFSVATPCLANNGSRIYFSSDMPGGYGGDDLYYCDKVGNSWGEPVNMGPTVNTFGDEKFPSIDSAGNLYFSSTGYIGYGGMDICVSKNINGQFQQAHVLKEPFNSAGDDYGITFLKTGKVGYFSSARNAGQGDEDIYYFNLDKDSLPCKINTADYVVGFRCPPVQKQVVKVDTVRKITGPMVVENGMIRVHFDFDKYNIRPDAAGILDTVASYMQRFPDIIVLVNGYCDTRGTYAYNMVLSDHRSEAVVNYLAGKGIDRSRMKPKGYGKTHLLNGCTDGVVCTPVEQEQNRRVEIIVNPNNNVTVK